MFYEEWFANSNLLMWPMIGLLIFFLVFLIVIVRVLAITNRDKNSLNRIASLPLVDDDAPLGGDYPKGAA